MAKWLTYDIVVITKIIVILEQQRTTVVSHLYRYIYIYIYIYKDKFISDVLQWTPSHGRAKEGRPDRTYIQQLCTDTGCSIPEDLLEAMDDREEWRERFRNISADDATWWWYSKCSLFIYIYIYIYSWWCLWPWVSCFTHSSLLIYVYVCVGVCVAKRKCLICKKEREIQISYRINKHLKRPSIQYTYIYMPYLSIHLLSSVDRLFRCITTLQCG